MRRNSSYQADWATYTNALGGASNAPFDVVMGEQWGLERIRDPGLAYSDSLGNRFIRRKLVQVTNSKNVEQLEAAHGLGWTMQGPTLMLEVDIEAPIEALCARFKAQVFAHRELRRSSIKPLVNRARNSTVMVEYLRVLDACARGVAYRLIGDVLRPTANNDAPRFPRDDAMRRARVEASKLVEGDYKALPQLAEPNGPLVSAPR